MTLPGGPEWVIILFIVLLFFGAKKLPGLASSVGTSMKEFRRASREALEDDEDDEDTDASGSATDEAGSDGRSSGDEGAAEGGDDPESLRRPGTEH